MMSEFVGSRAGFWNQSNALLRKNLTFQKRRICANVWLVLIPGIFCVLFAVLQYQIDANIIKYATKQCVKKGEYAGFYDLSNPEAVSYFRPCTIRSPREWPPVVRVPENLYRAVRTDSLPWTDLPDASCKSMSSPTIIQSPNDKSPAPTEKPKECPATILITGNNQTFGQKWAESMFPALPEDFDFSGNSSIWSKIVVASESDTADIWEDSALQESRFGKLYNLQNQCDEDDDEEPIQATLRADPKKPVKINVTCLQCFKLWRNSSSEINDEIFKGQQRDKANMRLANYGYVSAYDISNSDEKNFNVTIWYDPNKSVGEMVKEERMSLRVPRLVNMASNAYLDLLSEETKYKIEFDFMKEMPKGFTAPIPDMTALLGPLFFSWVVLLLFPVVLASLVYEKQERLRVMMKMHGLGDGPYWLIQYSYFLVISVLYILCFVAFGSALGINFFFEHDFSLTFTFFFLYVNLQIALAFLLSSMFSRTRSATVVAYLLVFGGGFVGMAFFSPLIVGGHVSKAWIILLELYPGFALYRGLFELGQYTTQAKATKTGGMRWGDLNDSENGMADVLIIMPLEFIVLMLLAYYVDQVVTCRKSLLFFFPRKKAPALNAPSMRRTGSKGLADMDKPDVAQEAEKVERLMEEAKYSSHVVLCDSIKKVYQGIDGNPEKFAVRGLSLALPQGECFGMLGPSGAGKTSFIEMLIGLTRPSAGTAYIQGLNLVTQMHEIYACIGVCPQDNLLWATLTGREHLLFYGRLKNLNGSELTKAVEDSLKSLNLFYGGVADKRAGQYSGGMKRRLSVAIALIGNPIAVYMDEPSTGLDPASRNTLWNVVKLSKQGRVIILTTHSMEEAEFLCDRIGIFVDGRLQCIGNPKELKGKYGGTFVFTITTDTCHEKEIRILILRLAPDAIRVYHLAGTQKFEFPKSEVRIADVFEMVEGIKKMFTVYAWGLADTTLEDVFVKVASAPKKLESNVLGRDD